jgi:hypothetical protein
VIVRIVGPAIDRIVRLPVGEVGRDIGLAEDDRAGALELADHPGVARGDRVGIFAVTPGSRQAADIEAFLDRHRHAEQRLVLGQPPGGHGLGLFLRAVEVGHHHRVDMRVEMFDPRNRRFDRLEWRHLSMADRARNLDRTGFRG